MEASHLGLRVPKSLFSALGDLYLCSNLLQAPSDILLYASIRVFLSLHQKNTALINSTKTINIFTRLFYINHVFWCNVEEKIFCDL